MSAKRSNEPAVWMLFGIGGFLVAFLLPVQIFLYGIAFPLKWLPDPGYAGTLSLAGDVLTRIYLVVLVFFALFHAAHRIRLTMGDVLQMRHLNTALGVLLYGAALAGSIITLVLAIRLP